MSGNPAALRNAFTIAPQVVVERTVRGKVLSLVAADRRISLMVSPPVDSASDSALDCGAVDGHLGELSWRDGDGA